MFMVAAEYRDGRVAAAAHLLAEYLEDNPSNADALFSLGLIQFELVR
jgi:hypothetical protein